MVQAIALQLLILVFVQQEESEQDLLHKTFKFYFETLA